MNTLQVVNKYHLNQTNSRCFYIGRPSPLGNPFPMNEACTRDQACDQYDLWLIEQIRNHNIRVIHELERIAAMVMDDTGKPVSLICYCAPKRCHGDIIKRVILDAIREAA